MVKLDEYIIEYNSPRQKKKKVTNKQIVEIKSAVKTENLQKLYELLSVDIAVGLTDLERLSSKLKHLAPSKKFELIDSFLSGDKLLGKLIAGKLMLQTKYWSVSESRFWEILQNFFNDSFWMVREIAAECLAEACICNHSLLEKFGEFMDKKSLQVRIGTSNSIKYMIKDQEILHDLFPVLLKYLDDPNLNVKTNISIYGIGTNGLKHNPDDILKWISQIKAKVEDEKARSSLLNVFTTQYGIEYPEQALDLVDAFLDDPRDLVRRTRESVVRALYNSNFDRIQAWFNSHPEHPEAMGHWASIEADYISNLDKVNF